MSETLLPLRAALTAAIESTTDESLLLAALSVLMRQNQQQIEKTEKKKKQKQRLDIRGLATLITGYLETNGPSTSEAVWESLRNQGQVHQNIGVEHIERQLKKQVTTYVLLPSGKWWLKNRKIENKIENIA